jgi:uncharacterized protein (DUF433 family)
MVSDILELIAAGEPVENILRSYPSITTEMINEALMYAAKLALDYQKGYKVKRV